MPTHTMPCCDDLESLSQSSGVTALQLQVRFIWGRKTSLMIQSTSQCMVICKMNARLTQTNIRDRIYIQNYDYYSKQLNELQHCSPSLVLSAHPDVRSVGDSFNH